MFKINDTVYYYEGDEIKKDTVTKIRVTEDTERRNAEYFLHKGGYWLKEDYISKSFDEIATVYVKETEDKLKEKKDYIKTRKNQLK